MKAIIVPLDFSDESLNGLNLAVMLADKTGANIQLVHILGKNLTDLTLDYSRSMDADLISIVTEQEKSASNLLSGNSAHQTINKAFIPVLSFPNYHLRVTAEDIWTLGTFNL